MIPVQLETNFQNMKELKPNQLSDLIAFSTASQENLERSSKQTVFNTAIGEVFRQGKLCYVARNSCIEVIHCEDGSRKGSYNFEKDFDGFTISSVISRRCYTDKTTQLILSLKSNQSSTHGGIICIFDIDRGKVIKAIGMPSPITAITEINNVDNIDIKAGLVSELLEDYNGILAVGTVGGELYLLDIRDGILHEDSTQPAEVFLVKTEDDLAYFKQQGDKTKQHCCIYLTDSVCSSKAFQYVDPNSKPLRVLPRDEVSVSKLFHLRQCGILACGFSFGCFQLWDLNALEPVYSSLPECGLSECRLSESGFTGYGPPGCRLSGITHFLFQEPENDPKHCAYLWVGRGPLPWETDSEGPTTISLYQLVFDVEKMVHGIGIVYQVLDFVGLRFEHQLTYDVFHLADSSSVGGRILCCHVLERDNKVSGEKMEVDGPQMDSTLAYFVWEAPIDHTESTCHLGIFDLNRWYHMQLPHTVSEAAYGRRDVTCPFFAFYSLTEVTDVVSPDGIVDVYVNPDEIQMYSSSIVPRPEQYFWPSSLAFECICLSERSLIKAEMLGIQRQILADIIKKGTHAFSEANTLFNMFWGAGLIPNTFDISRPQDKQLHFEALLSVVLEHNAVLFVQSCIRRWTAGDITFQGCSLRLVLNWAWKRIISTKEQLDSLHYSLFDGYSGELDSQCFKVLDQCSLHMHHLVEILQTLQDCPVPVTEEGSSDFKIKLKVAVYIKQYVDALLMLVDYGLLPITTRVNPSHMENHEMKYNVVYPVSTLLEYYTARRSEISGPVGPVELHIDKFSMGLKQYIDDFGMNTDLEWDGVYPPPSVNAVCRLFLLDLGEDEAKKYFYYWALDLDECLGKAEDEMLSTKCAYKFKISDNERDAMQALWFVDHKLYDEGVKRIFGVDLSQPVVKDVIITLFKEGETAYALQLLLGSKLDYTDDASVAVFIDMLLQNGRLAEAYRIQNKLYGNGKDRQLYRTFLEKCYEYKLMNKLFELPLPADEESILIEFLSNHKERRAADLLLTYFLQRGLHMEVVSLRKKMMKNAMTYTEPGPLHNALTQQAITDSYVKVLPRIQQKLMADPVLQSLLVAKQAENVHPLKPLSAVTKLVGKGGSHSRAGILHAALCSIEANNVTREDNSTFKPFLGLPITPKKSGQGRLFSDSIVVPKKEKKDTPIKGKHERPQKSIPQTDIPIKRRKHLYSGAGALHLLKTPPVVKRPQVQPVVPTSVFTPPSILKSRNQPKISQLAKHDLSEDFDGSIVKSLEPTDSTRRKIRFAVVNSIDSSQNESITAQKTDPSITNDASCPANLLTSVEGQTTIASSERTRVEFFEKTPECLDNTTDLQDTLDASLDLISASTPDNSVLCDETISPEIDDQVKKNLEFDVSPERAPLSCQASDLRSEDPKALDSGLDLRLEDEDDLIIVNAQSENTNPEDGNRETDSDIDVLSQSTPSEEYVTRIAPMTEESGEMNVDDLSQPASSELISAETLTSEPKPLLGHETYDNGLESEDSGRVISENNNTENDKEDEELDIENVQQEGSDIQLNDPIPHRTNILLITEEDVREVHTTTEEIVVIDESSESVSPEKKVIDVLEETDEAESGEYRKENVDSKLENDNQLQSLQTSSIATEEPEDKPITEEPENEPLVIQSVRPLDDVHSKVDTFSVCDNPPIDDAICEEPACISGTTHIDENARIDDTTEIDSDVAHVDDAMETNDTLHNDDYEHGDNAVHIEDTPHDSDRAHVDLVIHSDDPAPIDNSSPVHILDNSSETSVIDQPAVDPPFLNEGNEPLPSENFEDVEPIDSSEIKAFEASDICTTRENENSDNDDLDRPELVTSSLEKETLISVVPDDTEHAVSSVDTSNETASAALESTLYAEPLVFVNDVLPSSSSAVQEIVLPTTVVHAIPIPISESPPSPKETKLSPKAKSKKSRDTKEGLSSTTKNSVSTPRRERNASPRKQEDQSPKSPTSPSKHRKRDQFKTNLKVDSDSFISPPLTRSASRRLSGTPLMLSNTRSSKPTYKVDSPLSFVTSELSTPTNTRRKGRKSLDLTPVHRMRLRSHIQTRSTPRILENK